MNTHKLATELYNSNANAEAFAQAFTLGQLVELWLDHCIYKKDDNGNITPPDAAYDDEVYDALDYYGYWKHA